MKPTLDVDLGGISLRSPVMAAAGCLRSLRDVHGLVDVRKFGAVVSQTLTVEPISGPYGDRAAETPSGLLTDTGFQNPGVDVYLGSELPLLVRAGVPVIVSIGGGSVEQVIRAVNLLWGASGVVAIELNLAFPLEGRGQEMPAARGDQAAELIGAVVRMSRLPVFAKLSADVGDVVDVARACRAAGAHGFTLINGVRGMQMGRSVVRGWLGGPAIRPMAIDAVAQVAFAMPDVPIIGCGGVVDAPSAVEHLQAGAWAVQVGTAMLIDPDSPIEITKGILRTMRSDGVASPADLRLLASGDPEPAQVVDTLPPEEEDL